MTYDHATSMAHLTGDVLLYKDWLTPDELAEKLGVHVGTVYYWLACKWITAERKPKAPGATFPNSEKHARYRIPEYEYHALESFEHKHFNEMMKFIPRVRRTIR